MSKNRQHIRMIPIAIFLTACVVAFAAAGAMSASAQTKKADARTQTTKRPKKDTVRTLDAINIEGEIAVPQVLFITGRDVRRYRDGLEWKFRKNTLDVARSLDLPTRLRIVAKHKEER